MYYDVILGIDLGHGEVAAHFITARGSTILPCILDPNTRSYTLFTAIGYTGDTVTIGEAAKDCDECYSYFKASPGAWDEIMLGANSGGGKSKKQLMEDFLRQLMRQIKDGNDTLKNLLPDPPQPQSATGPISSPMAEARAMLMGERPRGHENPGRPLSEPRRDSDRNDGKGDKPKVQLMVGCPASEDWTADEPRKAYEDLISRATGIAREHVRVVPESRAAIFSVFSMHKDIVIDTNKGVAIDDIGSSTSDHTYMQMGKYRIEHSWTLGASRIEQYLTGLALARAKLNTQELYTNSMERLPLAVRSDKEAYFLKGKDMQGTHTIDKAKRENGREVRIPKGVDQYNGMPVYDCVPITVPINNQTMSFVTDGKKLSGEEYEGVTFDPTFSVRKDGKDDWERASWSEHCRKFFEAIKKELDDRKLSCDTVVLTGGASKMFFVQRLWRETFKGVKNLICEPNPSFSVSIGLCYLGYGDAKLSEAESAYTPTLRDSVSKQITVRLDSACKELTQYIYAKTGNFIEKLSDGDYLVTTVSDEITKAFEGDPELEKIITRNLVTELSKSVLDAQKRFAKDVLKAAYPNLESMTKVGVDKAFANSLAVTGVDWGRLFGNLDLRGLISKIAGSVAAGVAGTLVGLALVIILSGTPLGWFLGLVFGSSVVEMVSEFLRDHGNEWVSKDKLRKGFNGENEKLSAEIRASIKEQLHAELKAALENSECMGENYGTYLDKIEAGSCKLVKILSMQEFEQIG